MTAPLDYIKAVADQASERSMPGSVTVELARLTREVVAELREVRQFADAHHSYAAGRDGGSCGLCAALAREAVSL
jgi:hypothetical protein